METYSSLTGSTVEKTIEILRMIASISIKQALSRTGGITGMLSH